MKNKLLTVFDDEEYLTNVISALTLDVDEVYYVYHHDVPNENFVNVDKVLNRYHEVKTHFFKLEDDVIEIGNIFRAHPNIIIDVGGAKYLSLLLFELAKDRDNKIIYFDDKENVIKDYRTHNVFVSNTFKLSIEDVFNLRNGEIVEKMHRNATDRKTVFVINTLVENNLENYTSFVRYITKLNTIISGARRIGGKTYGLTEKQLKEIVTDNCYRNCQELFELEDTKLTFTTAKLRQLIGVSGAFLENYLYNKLTDSRKFDNVEMSAVIDFSNRKYNHPVRCEIDLLAIKDNKLLLISCKSNKIDTTDLNEIYTQNSLFGNVLSYPVICVCEDADHKYPSIYSKAEEMSVYVIDKSNMMDESFPEVFSRIIEGTYVYDEITL